MRGVGTGRDVDSSGPADGGGAMRDAWIGGTPARPAPAQEGTR